MFNTSWPVLIVDDDSDVLTLSKLAMQDFTVYGLPLELYTAGSKAEAIELMNTTLVARVPTLPTPRISVAFIDVVMETDMAGLELCELIRNEYNNHAAQLFIRTGQPGVAPEREVIDRYDINGYFTKAEATEDKLYSLVKSGVRQNLSFMVAALTTLLSSMMSAAASSRQSLRNHLQNDPILSREGHFLAIDGEYIAGSLDEALGWELLTSLDQLPSQSLGVGGNKFVLDSDQNVLIKIAGNDAQAEVVHIIQGDWKFMPPDAVKTLMQAMMSALASHWKRAE